MARTLYSFVLYLLTPLILVRLLWRSLPAPAYRHRWRERFGRVPAIRGDGEVIWVHSVSVGETLAAIPLIEALGERYPGAAIAVTTMTPTGSERVRAVFGDRVYHVYAPYDLPHAIARFLGRLRPRMLIIMETELWPNLIHACRQRHIPVVLANARLSAKSAAGYRRFARLTRPMLESLSVVAAQTRDDGERFLKLGLPVDTLRVTGNIKFDLKLDEQRRALAGELDKRWRGSPPRPIWLAASTHRGEEAMILAAHRRLLAEYPSLLLVLVPRHPERFDEVASLCREQGFVVVRRSSGESPGPDHQVLLGDTMGELPVFFGACDLAFVGGSLVPVGGHNMIEPAAWGVPVVSGPHLFNFAEASKLLADNGGMKVCADPQALVGEVGHWLGDAGARRAAGVAAREVAEANRGALARLLGVISRQMPARSQ